MKFPEDFKEILSGISGDFEFETLIRALESSPVLSIRKNLGKTEPEIFNSANKVPWEHNACYLKERPSFTADPEWHAGAYYVQEASSMIIKDVLNPYLEESQPLHALDLCAAPGGKSTHLLSFLPLGSTLLSNEVDRQRFQILKENSIKWGHPAHAICSVATREFMKTPDAFDLILVDAPCSGEGMFRKDPQAITHWSKANIELCHWRQKEILEHALVALKPGGILLYSTCTFNNKENEDIGEWLINDCHLEPLALNIDSSFGFTTRRKGKTEVLIAYPHKVQGEGFACQLLQKPNLAGRANIPYKVPAAKPKTPEHFFPLAKNNWNGIPLVFNYSTRTDSWYAVPECAQYLNGILQILGWPPEAGVCLGTWKGKDFIPHHHLLSSGLESESLSAIEVNKENALFFLKGQNNFDVPITTENPWKIIRYRNQNLGWIKWAGQRFNNYYPKNFRIRSAAI